MWCDHLFSQRNKATERAVGMGVRDDRKRGLDRIFKKGEVDNIGGLELLCQLWIFYFQQVFVFCWLINKNVLEWFPLRAYFRSQRKCQTCSKRTAYLCNTTDQILQNWWEFVVYTPLWYTAISHFLWEILRIHGNVETEIYITFAFLSFFKKLAEIPTPKCKTDTTTKCKIRWNNF